MTVRHGLFNNSCYTHFNVTYPKVRDCLLVRDLETSPGLERPAPLVPDAAQDDAAKVDVAGVEVTVYRSFEEARGDWKQLKGTRHSSPYQCLDWLKAWLETLGRGYQIQPVIAVGRIENKTVVILPMGLQRRKGVTTLSFLGHQNGNQNTGHWDAGYYSRVTANEARALLVDTCRQTGADLLALQNVPETWHGRRHPLILGKVIASPSPVFECPLPPDFDTLFEQTHSKSSRRNLLRKQRRLEAAEGFRVVKAEAPEDIQRGVDAFLEQRAKRALAAGIPNIFSGRCGRDFVERLLGISSGDAGTTSRMLDLWFLEAGGAIRSTYLCLEHAGTIYSYSTSIAHDDMTQNSPGIVLIKEIIRYACAAPHLLTLDLGLGEERYKKEWAEPVPLNDCLYALTWKGAAKETLVSLRTRAKAAVRNSAFMWSLVRSFRKWKAGFGNTAGNRSKT